MRCSLRKYFLYLLFFLCVLFTQEAYSRIFVIGESSQLIFTNSSFSTTPAGGDTIKILAERRSRLQFRELVGMENAPIVFINSGGVVKIKGYTMPAIMFENCKYVKITGKGDLNNRFGFNLTGPSFGLSFEQYCSHCEAEFMHIDSCSLGVHAKKDFNGHPPVPYPVFDYLALHDNLIEHCTESMYIGETKSPGMEFKHVRIYNNVILNSNYESFQIANCVDDIEVYNNFCYNSGLKKDPGQSNNSQLGGNSIAKFYNNIFIKAPAQGIAVFGKGDIYLINNYLEENQGIFADDRYLPVRGAPFRIENNFFRNMTSPQIMDLRNSDFDFYIKNNQYNTNIKFSSANPLLVKEQSGNLLTTVLPLLYTVVDGQYSPDVANPVAYSNMGPKVGLSHTFNFTPVLDSVPDIIINTGTFQEFSIVANTADQDSILFSAKNLPPFASIAVLSNGRATLKVDGRGQSKSVWFVTLMANDKSHGAVARRTFKIALKDPNNHPVTLPHYALKTIEAASKSIVDISGSDLDGDSIRYTITNKPLFVDFIQTKTSASFELKPTNIQTGYYSIVVRAEDGYSNSVVDTFKLNVIAPTLYPGKIIYRVNYGGGADLVDSPINWQKDNGDASSYEANYSMGTGSGGCGGHNLTDAPNSLFGPFRYNGVGQVDMLFEYPCVNARYKVDLYFCERSNEVLNNLTEVFNIYLENELKQENVNLFNEAGYDAVKKSYFVDVFDNSISLKLKKILNNTKLNGVQISFQEFINLPPTFILSDTIKVYGGKTTVLPIKLIDDHFSGCNNLVSKTDLSTDLIYSTIKNDSLYLTVMTNEAMNGQVFLFTLTVSDGCLTTQKNCILKVLQYHWNAPLYQEYPMKKLYEGVKDTVVVKFIDADNDPMKLSVTGIPSFATFVDKGNGVGWLFIEPNYLQAGFWDFSVTATDNYNLSATKKVTFSINEAQPIQQIVLNTNMIHDLVQGGSVNPVSLLVDEQSFDPDKNEHPVSANWKPYFTNIRAPYHIYFDLGKEYVIRKLKIHDMNNVSPLLFSYGTPDSWAEWFNCLTNRYNAWVSFDVESTTRYLRLSQINASSAEVNELVLYGYEVNHAPKLKSISALNFSDSKNDTITFEYVDAENDAIRLTAINLPNFAIFSHIGNGLGQIVLKNSEKVNGKYSVVLTANDSKYYTSNDTVCIDVSGTRFLELDEPQINSQIRIYLDEKQKTVHLLTNVSDCRVELRSISGQLVLVSKESVIPISKLSEGAYLILVFDAKSNRILARKILLF